MNPILAIAAAAGAGLLVTACSESADPTPAGPPPRYMEPAIATRAADPKFEAFRELCREQQRAVEAVAAFRRTASDPMTPDEAARHGALMAAVKPISDRIDSWFERGDLSADDLEALRRIHDVEIPAEFAAKP